MSASKGTLLGGLLLGLLVEAAVAGGVTFAVFGGGDTARSDTKESEPDPESSANARTSEDAAARVPELAVARTEGGAEPDRAPPDLLDTVGTLLADAPTPRQAVGTGTIQGKVRDQEGNPVAGVTVRARRNAESSGGSSRRGKGPPAPESLKSRVHRSVEAWYREQAEVRETVTGADGSYQLTRLLTGTYRVEAWREGATVEADGNWWRAEPGSSVHFTARILMDVPVVVRLPDGNLAQNATLDVSEYVGDGQTSHTDRWTADEPVMRLAAGRFEVKATLKQGMGREAQELASATESFRLSAKEPPPSLDLQLKGRMGVRGQVLAPEEEPFDSAVVSLMPLPAGQEPDLILLGRHDTNTWVHSRDPSFEFMDLAPGRYVVGVARDWRQPILAHAVLDVRDRVAFQDLQLPPLDASECVVVRAQGPDGQPVLDLDFRLEWERRNSSTSTGADGILKPNDTYWVMLPEEGREVLQGQWDSGTSVTLTVESSRYGNRTVPLEQGQRAVLVRFVEPATLTVRAPGYHGSGYEGRLTVYAQRDEGSRRSTQGQASQWSEQGSVEVGPLEPGDYLVILQVSSSDRFRSDNEIARAPVRVRPGVNEVTVAIPVLYSLRVRVPDGDSSGRMNLSAVGRDSQRHVELSSEGVATFEHLPAGAYRLEYFGGGMPGFMTVQVPQSGVVTFEEQPVNALECRITDPNGTLAKAGLQSGDLIIAVDGKEFQNVLELQAVFMTMVSSKEPVEFTILRGSSTFPVQLEAMKVMNSPQEMGGTFEPTSR